MKFYKLSHTELYTQEIGCFPQCQSYNILGNIHEYVKEYKIIENFVLPEPILMNEAELSTYLTGVLNSNVFLTIKKQLLDILLDFRINKYDFWQIDIHYKEEILKDYFLFHVINSSQSEFVDYKNSEFLVGKLGDWKDTSIRKLVQINDYKEYANLIEVLNEKKDKSQIRCNKLIFNLSNANVDLFRLADMPYFGSGYYVSERLKDAIEQHQFTGMRFQEIEEFNNKIKVIY